MLEHENLGKTKLDHVLSYISIGAMELLKLTLILFLPLLVVEQLVIYGTNHPDQIIPLLLVLMIVVAAYGYKLFKDWRKKDEEIQ